jgi:hypothetical protein
VGILPFLSVSPTPKGLCGLRYARGWMSYPFIGMLTLYGVSSIFQQKITR